LRRLSDLRAGCGLGARSRRGHTGNHQHRPDLGPSGCRLAGVLLRGSGCRPKPSVTDYLHSGHHPRRNGNVMRFAASSAFPTKDGLVQLAASNARQHRRFYEAIGDPEEAKRRACRSARGHRNPFFLRVTCLRLSVAAVEQVAAWLRPVGWTVCIPSSSCRVRVGSTVVRSANSTDEGLRHSTARTMMPGATPSSDEITGVEAITRLPGEDPARQRSGR
jgi:hypothetical protein